MANAITPNDTKKKMKQHG